MKQTLKWSWCDGPSCTGRWAEVKAAPWLIIQYLFPHISSSFTGQNPGLTSYRTAALKQVLSPKETLERHSQASLLPVEFGKVPNKQHFIQYLKTRFVLVTPTWLLGTTVPWKRLIPACGSGLKFFHHWSEDKLPIKWQGGSWLFLVPGSAVLRSVSQRHLLQVCHYSAPDRLLTQLHYWEKYNKSSLPTTWVFEGHPSKFPCCKERGLRDPLNTIRDSSTFH